MMKRLLSTTAVLTALLALAPAQNLAPQQKATENAQPEEVFRVQVNLVQVDAVVTDDKGNLVDDLKASEFEVRQDGKPQNITNFSYVSTKPGSAGVRTASKLKPTDPKAPPPVPLRNDQIKRVFALVVDDLGLAAETIPAVRKALERFVDQEMQPGDLAAILRTGGSMGALQQFTTDKRVLHAAINQVKYNSMSRLGIDSFRPAGSGSGMGAAAAQERRSQLNASSISEITYVVNGLRDIPGRKNVVLFSEDLRIMAGRDVDPRADVEMQRLTDSAGRASVVISSIDPRGLQTLQLTAADHPRNAQQASSIPMQRATDMFFSQDGMVRLADATGGIFLHDNNDIGGQLHQIVEESNGYYLIGYHPAAETFDKKTGQPLFRRVTVRVKRPGLTVHSRKGFLNNPDAPIRVAERTPQQDLVHAMTSPFSTGAIHVQLTALFYNSTKAGSFLNALLHVDAKDLQFEDAPDNMHKIVLDVLSATFNEKGVPEEPIEKVFTLTYPEAKYQQALKSGILYQYQHIVKKPGGYQMRIALRDSGTLKIGSASQYVEVPDIAKGHLEMSSVSLSDNTGAQAPTGEGAPPNQARENPLGSPAVRSFLPGEMVMYAFQVLNPKLDSSQKPQLQIVSKIFRDGAQIYESPSRPVDILQQADATHILSGGELRLGPKLLPGDYVLQVIVTDKLADEKTGVVSQWMDFTVRPPE